MKLKASLLILLLTFTSTAALAADSWIHVRVESEKGEKVRVNLPLSLVSTVLPILKEKKIGHTQLRMNQIEVGDQHLSVSDLRQIWTAIRQSGSYELANVESQDANVNVFLDGQYLRVETKEPSKEQVLVKVPAAVVDALLSGSGEELDLMAAVNALAALGDQQLVEIQSDDSKVRVWIDSKNNGQ